MRRIAALGIVASLILSSPVLAHEGHDDGPTEQTFKIAANGEVKFGEDVRFGDILIKKGKYVLEHRIDGERHVIVLSATTKAGTSAAMYTAATETLAAKVTVKKSAVYATEGKDRILRVTVVQIVGENLDHLPGTTGIQATR